MQNFPRCAAQKFMIYSGQIIFSNKPKHMQKIILREVPTIFYF